MAGILDATLAAILDAKLAAILVYDTFKSWNLQIITVTDSWYLKIYI